MKHNMEYTFSSLSARLNEQKNEHFDWAVMEEEYRRGWGARGKMGGEEKPKNSSEVALSDSVHKAAVIVCLSIVREAPGRP